MPIPTVTEVEEFKEDLDDAEALVNGFGQVVTRTGGTKDSYSLLVSRIAHGDIAAYSAAATYTEITDWVTESGIVYRPDPSQLPIGPESFDANKWFVAQGHTQADGIVAPVETYAAALALPTSLPLGAIVPIYGDGIAGNFVVTTGAISASSTGVLLSNAAWNAAGKHLRRISGYGNTLLSQSLSVWTPTAQPGANEYISVSSATASDFIDDLWEPLRAEFPDWVSRSSLGLDESGSHTVWQYKFQPEQFDRTVVIGCCVHGGEVVGQLATHAFFRSLAYDWSSHPQLSAARFSTRWVVIPMVNPWGVSQSPRTRYNSNGVDINRNFGFKWESYTGDPNPGDDNYKGTAVWSEAEARYFRDAVIVNYRNAHAVIDAHSFVNAGSSDKYIVYLPDYSGHSNREMFVDLIEELTRVGEEGMRLVSATANPSTQNYFAREGYTSANPEYAPQSASGSTQTADSADMTQALRWYGNIYLRCATRATGKQKRAFSPFIRQYALTGTGPVVIPLSATYDAVLPEDTFTVSTHGVLQLTGFATLRNSGPGGSTFFIRHYFGQDGGAREQFKSSNSTTVIESFEHLADTTARSTLPFSAAIPVYPGQTIRFRPQMRGDSTAGVLMRYTATIKFTPTDTGDQYRWFTSDGPLDPWEDTIT